MSKFDVITIGDSTVDTFLVINEASLEQDLEHNEIKLCLEYGDKIPIKTSHQSVGGNAANVAFGLKKQGYKTSIITELGDDINGHVIQQKFRNKDLNMDFVQMHKEKNSRYGMVISYKGERTVLSYYADRNYSLPELPKTDYIYYTSLGPSFENLQQELIKYLKENKNTKLALNPGSHQIKKGKKYIEKILPFVEILFVNKREAQKLTKDTESRKELVNRLHKKGVNIVSMTEGTKGACMSDGEDIYQMKPYSTDATGKTGAGDAYASGFLGALLDNQSHTEAMKWGTANAWGVIQHLGANEGVLNKKEIKSKIKQNCDIKPNLV